MAKFIDDEASKNYRKQLQEFQATINPKPTPEEQQKLREEYLLNRKKVKS